MNFASNWLYRSSQNSFELYLLRNGATVSTVTFSQQQFGLSHTKSAQAVDALLVALDCQNPLFSRNR